MAGGFERERGRGGGHEGHEEHEAPPVPGKRTLVEEEYVHDAAAHGTSGGGGAIPHLAQIQQSFGKHDISGISAHTDDRASEGARAMGAQAFADGDHVAFAGAPSLHTAAHEAAHVVQQRAGVHLKGGVGEAGDPHEQHANAVADLVVQGKSAESLLDRYGGGGGSGGRRGGTVQRLESNFGKFDTTNYTTIGAAGAETGVDIKLTFDPDVTKVDAQKIGLVQSVRTVITGTPFAAFPAINDRVTKGSKDAADGTQIDRFGGGPYGNPLYAANSPTGKEKNLGETPTVGIWGQHGWAYKDAKGKQEHQIATLHDAPQAGHQKNSLQEFETAAVAVEGKQAGTYMGSVSWGWSTDNAGKFTKKPFALVSAGNPSKGFVAAAKQWNSVKSFGNVQAGASPTKVFDTTFSSSFDIAQGTAVKLKGGAVNVNNEVYNDLDVKVGKTMKYGYAKTSELKDVGGANPVLKLPIP